MLLTGYKIRSLIFWILTVGLSMVLNPTLAQKVSPEDNSLRCFKRQLKVDGISKDTLMLLKTQYQKALNDFVFDTLSALVIKVDSTLRSGGYIKVGYLVPEKWASCLDSSYRKFTPAAKVGGINVLISEFGMKHELYELYYFTMTVAATTKPE